MKRNIQLLIFFSIIIGIGAIKLTIEIQKTVYKDEIMSLSQWGDFIGGVFGTAISFLGLVATIIASVFVYNTLATQNQQLRLQQETETYNRVSRIIIKKLEDLNNQIHNIRFGNTNGWQAILEMQFDPNSDNTPESGNNEGSWQNFGPFPYLDDTEDLRLEICLTINLISNLITGSSTQPMSIDLINEFRRLVFFQTDTERLENLLTQTNVFIVDRHVFLGTRARPIDQMEIDWLERIIREQTLAISQLQTFEPA